MPIAAHTSELKLNSSALNSGGMLRKKFSRSLYRGLTQATGIRQPWDGSRVPSSSSVWSQYSGYNYLREYSNGGLNIKNSATPLPKDDKLTPPLAIVRPALDQQRLVKENTLKVNGFPKQRAKQRSEELKLRQASRIGFPLVPPSTLNVAASVAEVGQGHGHDTRPLSSSEASSSTSSSSTITTSPSRKHGVVTTSTSASSFSSESSTSTPNFSSAAATTSATTIDDDDGFETAHPKEAIDAEYSNEPPPDVFIVNTAETARKVAHRLLTDPSLLSTDRIFACDTEVMNIDVSSHSPCCHGRVICFSIYCGPDINFDEGNGQSIGPSSVSTTQPNKSMLWIDTYLDGDESKSEEIAAIIDAFRPFWESKNHRKVWHNYSFDRHVMKRMDITMNGFDGDTMHMARLWNSSRTTKGGYSLESLSSEEELMGPTVGSVVRGKVSMKTLFGKPNLKKDGTEGKLTVLPPVHELQSSSKTKWKWVNYSAYDAKSTWDLYRALEARLQTEEAKLDDAVAAAYARSNIKISTQWDLYRAVWRPFGNLLTDMEEAGMAVDRSHLAEAEKKAVAEEEEAKNRFRSWAASKVADAAYMNVGSGPQVTQLLFGGVSNRSQDKKAKGVPLERTFKVPNQLPSAEDGKKPKKNMDITLHNVWSRNNPSPLVPEIYTPNGLPACSTPVLKSLAGKPGKARKALAELGGGHAKDDDDAGLEALREDFDDVDTWTTDDVEIAKLQMERQELLKERSEAEMEEIAASKGYGKLFTKFSTLQEGLTACAAVESLVDASAIDTLLSNFIIPLQSDDISKPDSSGVYRVHCSLNINTETGRLSARRPNLQNQPALEKDRYKVRKAFTADRKAGKTLIVADYGQLELRILAHMANCQSMLTAFKLGGDFHSRTALGMYDHIQKAIANGDCLLEWDGGGNEDGTWTPPPAPLLKDMFAAERRKAKVLNFSIAYGKTAHGLSKDWGVSLDEAEKTVERWYADRPEVRRWQQEQHTSAMNLGYVCTILGRRRQLPDAMRNSHANKAAKAHALRAAINTPIQGSAADVATAAMLRISADQRLKDMGWRLLLQVHDEVILEGPKETAEAAQAVVVGCMQSPFGDAGGDPLRVELAVDSKYADTWYDAK